MESGFAAELLVTASGQPDYHARNGAQRGAPGERMGADGLHPAGAMRAAITPRPNFPVARLALGRRAERSQPGDLRSATANVRTKARGRLPLLRCGCPRL